MSEGRDQEEPTRFDMDALIERSCSPWVPPQLTAAPAGATFLPEQGLGRRHPRSDAQNGHAHSAGIEGT